MTAVTRSLDSWSLECFERFLAAECSPGIIYGDPSLRRDERPAFEALFLAEAAGPTMRLFGGVSIERRAWQLAAFSLFVATYVRHGSVAVVGTRRYSEHTVLRAAEVIVARSSYLRSIWSFDGLRRLGTCDMAQVAVVDQRGRSALGEGEVPIAVVALDVELDDMGAVCTLRSKALGRRVESWSPPFLLTVRGVDFGEVSRDVVS